MTQIEERAASDLDTPTQTGIVDSDVHPLIPGGVRALLPYVTKEWQTRLGGRAVISGTTLPPGRYPHPAGAASLRAGVPLSLPMESRRGVIVHALSVGNPQCVVWSKVLPRNWQDLGAALHRHAVFPDRTNVVFARRQRKGIDVYIWERGVGPTSASGTGAAAAAVVGARLGHTPRKVSVYMAGGTMRVKWRKDGYIELAAPAELVAEGNWPGHELQ